MKATLRTNNPGHLHGHIIQRVLNTERGTVYVEGPVSSVRLRECTMCSGLDKFRQPNDQHHALLDISNLAEGLIYIARKDSQIVGYITFHYPEFERWAQSGMQCLLELGALEVSKHWRGLGISKELVQIPFCDGRMEDNIVISMECYWSWDLRNTDMTVWEYRSMMENLLKRSGFETVSTDDPDIACHPANILSVRVGSQVNEVDVYKFDSLRFRGKCIL